MGCECIGLRVWVYEREGVWGYSRMGCMGVAVYGPMHVDLSDLGR